MLTDESDNFYVKTKKCRKSIYEINFYYSMLFFILFYSSSCEEHAKNLSLSRTSIIIIIIVFTDDVTVKALQSPSDTWKDGAYEANRFT